MGKKVKKQKNKIVFLLLLFIFLSQFMMKTYAVEEKEPSKEEQQAAMQVLCKEPYYKTSGGVFPTISISYETMSDDDVIKYWNIIRFYTPAYGGTESKCKEAFKKEINKRLARSNPTIVTNSPTQNLGNDSSVKLMKAGTTEGENGAKTDGNEILITNESQRAQKGYTKEQILHELSTLDQSTLNNKPKEILDAWMVTAFSSKAPDYTQRDKTSQGAWVNSFDLYNKLNTAISTQSSYDDKQQTPDQNVGKPTIDNQKPMVSGTVILGTGKDSSTHQSTSPTERPDYYDPSNAGEMDTDNIVKIASIIVNALNFIGIIVAVVVLTILGIKYMLGSASEKAEYKKTMIPYLVGVILLAVGTFLIRLVYNLIIGTGINNV